MLLHEFNVFCVRRGLTKRQIVWRALLVTLAVAVIFYLPRADAEGGANAQHHVEAASCARHAETP